jgi:hypothetical protein
MQRLSKEITNMAREEGYEFWSEREGESDCGGFPVWGKVGGERPPMEGLHICLPCKGARKILGQEGTSLLIEEGEGVSFWLHLQLPLPQQMGDWLHARSYS